MEILLYIYFSLINLTIPLFIFSTSSESKPGCRTGYSFKTEQKGLSEEINKIKTIKFLCLCVDYVLTTSHDHRFPRIHCPLTTSTSLSINSDHSRMSASFWNAPKAKVSYHIVMSYITIVHRLILGSTAVGTIYDVVQHQSLNPLRLSVQRLRTLQQKKEAQAKASRREIATLVEKGKIETAKIKTEASKDLL